MQRCNSLRLLIHFLHNPKSIVAIKKVMDHIEDSRLGYPDYSKRTGLIWSDFWVKAEGQPEIDGRMQRNGKAYAGWRTTPKA